MMSMSESGSAGVMQAFVRRLRGGRGESLVHRGRLLESKNVASVGNPTVARKVSPSSASLTQLTRPESVVVVGPSAQQRCPGGRERKVLAHAVAGIGVTGDDERALMVCDRRNPSTICSAVRTPQVPLAMSNENVP